MGFTFRVFEGISPISLNTDRYIAVIHTFSSHVDTFSLRFFLVNTFNGCASQFWQRMVEWPRGHPSLLPTTHQLTNNSSRNDLRNNPKQSINDMKALTITPQTSSDSDNTFPIDIDRFDTKSTLLEVFEIGECLSLDLSPPEDADEVFRDGRRSIVKEMLLVLKRANPISDYRDDSDIVDTPNAKRKKRSYDFAQEVDEREDAEAATLTTENSEDEVEEGETDLQLFDNIRPTLTNTPKISNILTILKEARISD